MIIGLGSDIMDIRRIEAVIARHGDRFLDRVFTPAERLGGSLLRRESLGIGGGAADRLKAITPPGHLAHVALTMTDEYPYAQAMVIISAVPLPAALGGRGVVP